MQPPLEHGLASEAPEYNLYDILAQLWAKKIFICFVTILSVCSAILYLHNARQTYTVVLKVTPASNDASSSLGNKIGGLANLANISLSPSGGEKMFYLYTEKLLSLDAAEVLAQDHIIMQTVFKEEFDPATKSWVKPNGSLRKVINFTKSILGLPVIEWSEPNYKRLHTFLQKSVLVGESRMKPIVTLEVQVQDPVFGKYLLKALHINSDTIVRKEYQQRTKEYIAYITQKIETEKMVEYRLALINILSNQEKMFMGTASSLEYSATSLSQPFASLKPTKPNGIFILLVSMVLGLGLGSLLVLLRKI